VRGCPVAGEGGIGDLPSPPLGCLLDESARPGIVPLLRGGSGGHRHHHRPRARGELHRH
jgi:hypothetical protein